MKRTLNQDTIKDAMLFNQLVMQVSKALWKSTEKDWEKWVKPYDLSINEHHILGIVYQLEIASMTDISKLGVMHLSTAFNFAKKLHLRGYLTLSKNERDKRNTYVQLTEEGKNMFLKTIEDYNPLENPLFQGAIPLRDVYGELPDFDELTALIRSIYGEDFVQFIERSSQEPASLKK